MIINTTTAYALRVLLFMASQYPEMVAAREVVSQLQIPDKYVRRLMTRLSKAELIASHQGRSGGYFFLKPPAEINLIDVLDAMNDTSVMHSCILGFSSCSDDNPCALHKHWADQRSNLMEIFQSFTLSQLLDNPNIKL
jgi:Rrf2 family protein